MTRTAESSRAPVPISRLISMSAGAAAIWALLGIWRGVTLSEYVVLFAGCTASLLLLQMAIEASRTSRAFGAGLFAVSGVVALPAALLAYWLAVNTNHRPLGAVTFVVLALVGALAVSALLSPAKMSARFAAALSIVAGLVLAWPLLSGELGFWVIADLAAGVALSVLVALLSRRRSNVLDSVVCGGASLVLLASASLFALTVEVGAGAAVKAPILAGIVGLLV